MTQLNHLSDNQLRITPRDLDGTPVSPATNWMKVYLRSGDRTFIATNDPQGADTKFCHVEGDKLVVDIPGKRLNVGIVEYMIEVREDSPYFADGYKNTFSLKYSPTDIEMI